MKNSFLIYIIFLIAQTAIAQPTYTIINTGTSSHISHISKNTNTLIINGWSNYLVKSFDECNSFIPLMVAGPTANYYNHSFSNIDDNTMYVLSANTSGTNQKIFKTIDGGNSWFKKMDTSLVDIVDFIGFFDASEGIAVVESNKIFRTKDGGNSWLLNYSPAASPAAFEIYSDSLVCMDDSFSGTLYLSKDRGNTWVPTWAFSGARWARDFFFLNNDTIFSVSSASNDIPGTLFTRTFNKGSTWSTVGLPLYTTAKTIYFKNKNEGYIIGQEESTSNALILKTTTLGQTWSKFELPIQELLMDIKFLNDSIALVSGTNGLLLKWNSKAAGFVGVKENMNDDIGISVFPNPVKDKIVIESKNNNGEVLEFNLFNGLGEKLNLSSKKINSKIEIDSQSLCPGIYYLKVQNNSEQKVIKIIKE